MILFVISGQFYVLYFKSCPANIFRESPNYVLAICIIGIILFQVLIVVLQIRRGPRFFIPSIFLPSYFNYYDENKIK